MLVGMKSGSTKILTLFMLILLFSSIFYVNTLSNINGNANSNATSIHDIKNDDFTGSTSSGPTLIPDTHALDENTKNLSDEYSKNTLEVTQTAIVTFPSEWYEGESVYITIQSPKIYPDINTISYSAEQSDYSVFRIPEDGGSITVLGNKGSLLSYDYDFWGVVVDDGSSSDYNGGWEATIFVDVPVPLFTENTKLYFAVILRTKDSSGSVDTWRYPTSVELKYEYVLNGRLHLRLWGRADGDWNSDQQFRFKLSIQTPNGYEIVKDQTSDPDNLDRSTKFYLGFDYCYVSTPDLEENIRSQYKYASSTQILHKLDIDVPVSGANITVYSPLTWNSSSVTPSVPISFNTNLMAYTFLAPYDTTYTLLFLSGDGWGVDYVRKPQLLALREVSSDYLQSTPGFEAGQNLDWETSEFTVTLSTDVVSEGSFSLHLEPSIATDSLYFTTPLPKGYYYVAFDYYIVSGAAQFYYATTGGSADYYSLDPMPNRWHSFFFYYHNVGSRTAGGYTWFFAIEESSGPLEMYFDNFRLYKSNTQITTTGLNKYVISGKLTSWDNRQSPVVPYSYVQIQLRDRTANSLVQSWFDVQTDSQGIFSVTYTGQLEEKEYEILAWDRQNQFGNWFYDVLHDPSDFEEDIDGWSKGAWGYSVSWGITNLIGKIDADTSNYLEFKYSFSTALDTEKYHYLEYEVYVNDTSNTARLYGYRADYSYTYYYGVNGEVRYFSVSTSYVMDDLLRWSYARAWDDSDITVFGMVLESPASVDLKIYLDNVKFLHEGYFSPYRFTPLPASEKVFTYKNENEWDYSEESKDDFYAMSGMDYPNFIYGLSNFSTNYRIYGTDYFFTSKTLKDVYNYPTIEFRLRYVKLTDDGLRVKVKLSTGTGLYPVISPTYTVNSYFTIYSIYLGSNSYWDPVKYPNARIYLTFSCASNNTIHADNIIQIDYVRLVHTKNAELYTSDTYALASSENDSLMYARFSDGQFTGYVNDLEFLNLNMSLGQHNLTLLPLSDSAEDFPGVFLPNYDSKIEFSYEIIEDFVISVETFSLSDSYVNLYITATKNGFYNYYFDNVFQGSGVFLSSGTAISLSRDTTPGKEYELEVKFYNGSDYTWFNISISNPEGESLTVEYFFYDVNDETFSITFGTNWHNQTATVYQNGTSIGTLHEDIVTVFTRPTSPNMYYNITVVIGSFKYQFGFKNAPRSIDPDLAVYYAEISPNTDAVFVETNWGNTTVYVYANGSLLGSGPEGLLLVDFDTATPGIYNVTLFIDGGTQFISLQTEYSVAFPNPEPEFQLLFSDFSYDTDAAIIYFSWASNWGNTTAFIYDNNTLLGSGIEQSIAVKFMATYGYHNITISLYTGSTFLLNLITGFTIARSVEIYEVSIDVFDALGLGLDFSTLLFYHTNISDANRLPKTFLWPHSNITILAVDYWGYVLWNQTYSLLNNQTNYIRISVPIYTVTYANPYNVSVSLSLQRGSGSVDFVVPANGSIQYRTTLGDYLIKAIPLYDNTEVPKYLPTTDSINEKIVSTLRHYQIYLEPAKFDIKKTVNTFDFSRLWQSFLYTSAILGGIFTFWRTYRYIKAKLEGKRIIIEDY